MAFSAEIIEYSVGQAKLSGDLFLTRPFGFRLGLAYVFCVHKNAAHFYQFLPYGETPPTFSSAVPVSACVVEQTAIPHPVCDQPASRTTFQRRSLAGR